MKKKQKKCPDLFNSPLLKVEGTTAHAALAAVVAQPPPKHANSAFTPGAQGRHRVSARDPLAERGDPAIRRPQGELRSPASSGGGGEAGREGWSGW